MRSATGHTRRMLATYLRPQWRSAALLALLLFTGIALELVSPQILRAFIDAATTDSPLNELTRLALIFMLVALFSQVVAVTATYAGERLAWRATNQLRSDLALHCLRLDMPFHKRHAPGTLIERIDGDVTALTNFFSQFIFQIAGRVLLLIGALLLIWWEEWRVGLALTIFSAVAAVLLWWRRTASVRYEIAESAAAAELFGFLEERLGGLDDLRANGAGGYTLAGFSLLQGVLARAERLAYIFGPQLWIITSLLFALGYLIALGMGAFLYLRGEISLGTVFLFFQYTELLRNPLERITRELQNFQEAGAGLVRVSELLAEQPAISDGSGTSLPAGPLSLAFEHVTFAYEDEAVKIQEANTIHPSPDLNRAPPSTVHHPPSTIHRPPSTPALDRVSFTLGPGRSLGLLGRTGSGKSTITRLLLRLYDPQEGQVLLGGCDLRELRLDELRGRIGIVTQEVQIFYASLRDNLTMFDPSIGDERLLAVLDTLGLSSWLAGLPAGLATELRSDGLSHGEAQLLALARVFLQDPALIILDEASARLDPATERLIERAIERLLAGRTAIIIAHRLQTVARVDEVLILEQGRVIERGERAVLAGNPESRLAQLLRVGMEEVLA